MEFFYIFGQNNCCLRLWKVAQSAINRPIWSHLSLASFRLFSVVSNKSKIMWKMYIEYLVLGFKLTPIEHRSSPITTWQGSRPHIDHSIALLCDHLVQISFEVTRPKRKILVSRLNGLEAIFIILIFNDWLLVGWWVYLLMHHLVHNLWPQCCHPLLDLIIILCFRLRLIMWKTSDYTSSWE